MMAYKIDLSMYTLGVRVLVSTEIQEHAFYLGYEWPWKSGTRAIDKPYLYFHDDKQIGYGVSTELFKESSLTKITAEEFCNLVKEEV